MRASVLRLARRLRSERGPGALSTNKVAVLAHLYREGPATPGQIAAADGQRPQSLTRTFTDLEHDGYLRRQRSSRDGRAALLTLTDAGARALRADMARRDAWLAGALRTLDDSQLAVLRSAADLLDLLASRAGGTSPADRQAQRVS